MGQALELHRSGSLHDAEAAYFKLRPLTHTPDLLRLLKLAGKLQQVRGMRAFMLRQVIETRPDFLDARRMLAVVPEKMGRCGEALSQHSMEARLAANDASILNDFGCALFGGATGGRGGRRRRIHP